MPQKIFNVLFLCTGNSARSIMAEALLNKWGRGKFKAWSAGSHPGGKVNPLALEMLRENGFDTTPCRSKSWDEFASPDAPEMDFVFTVCNKAAGEVCPIWPGQPMSAHWGVADPDRPDLPAGQQKRLFLQAFRELDNRIILFTSLPLESLEKNSLQKKIEEIGKTVLEDGK